MDDIVLEDAHRVRTVNRIEQYLPLEGTAGRVEVLLCEVAARGVAHNEHIAPVDLNACYV